MGAVIILTPEPNRPLAVSEVLEEELLLTMVIRKVLEEEVLVTMIMRVQLLFVKLQRLNLYFPSSQPRRSPHPVHITYPPPD